MIIIEGTDGVGKTTLAKKLAERLSLKYEHFGLLPKGWNYYHDYVSRMHRNSIYDRFYMSEIAYGQAVRGGSLVDSDAARLLDAHAVLHGAVVVVITATEELLRKTYTKDQLFTLEQVIRVDKVYEDIVFHRTVMCDFNIEAIVNVKGEVDFGQSDTAIEMICSLWYHRRGVLP